MKFVKLLLMLVLVSNVSASISCQNSKGYKVSISDDKSAEISTPYDNISVGRVGGSSFYFYGNVSSNFIRSFSLSVKGNNSTLTIIRKNHTPSLDRQSLKCSGTVK
jgi:hypothetical protein